MSKLASPYYPPRARWYGTVFQIGDAIRRLLRLDSLPVPGGISARGFLAGLLLPGMAFRVRGEKLIAHAVMLGWLWLAVVFIVCLGYPFANLAFGLLLSIHVTSILFLFNPWLVHARLPFRFATGLAILIVLGGGIYLPLRNQLQEHCLMPVRSNSEVVVVRRLVTPRAVGRGDWIAYTLEGGGGQGLQVRGGVTLGTVLAVAGDRIRFTANACEINGRPQPLLPRMPAQGELVVPEKHWFIWPELAITAPGNAGEAAISAAMLQQAVVPEESLFGKPFKRWFWRRQLPS